MGESVLVFILIPFAFLLFFGDSVRLVIVGLFLLNLLGQDMLQIAE